MKHKLKEGGILLPDKQMTFQWHGHRRDKFYKKKHMDTIIKHIAQKISKNKLYTEPPNSSLAFKSLSPN
jgi:hypothetical protein